MIIGAQLYSVCGMCKDMNGVERTLREMKNIGYDSVQVSGFQYDPNRVAEIAEEIGLHVGLTHTSIPEIINNTDAVIERHMILGADTVGIGSPAGYVKNEGGVREFRIEDMIRDLTPAVCKIQEAGLNFGVHNHQYELWDLGGYNALDVLYEKTNWNFTLDTGWVDFTGNDCVSIIKRFKDRLRYVHLKDFRAPLLGEGDNDIDNSNRVVPLYRGQTPVDKILVALQEVGTCNVAYVEQDNASHKEDPYAEMRASYEALRAHGWVE